MQTRRCSQPRTQAFPGVYFTALDLKLYQELHSLDQSLGKPGLGTRLTWINEVVTASLNDALHARKCLCTCICAYNVYTNFINLPSHQNSSIDGPFFHWSGYTHVGFLVSDADRFQFSPSPPHAPHPPPPTPLPPTPPPPSLPPPPPPSPPHLGVGEISKKNIKEKIL